MNQKKRKVSFNGDEQADLCREAQTAQDSCREQDFDLMTRAKWKRLQTLIECKKEEEEEQQHVQSDVHSNKNATREQRQKENAELHSKNDAKPTKNSWLQKKDGRVVPDHDYEWMTRAQWKQLQSIVENDQQSKNNMETHRKQTKSDDKERENDKERIKDRFSTEQQSMNNVDADDFVWMTRAQRKRLQTIVNCDDANDKGRNDKDIKTSLRLLSVSVPSSSLPSVSASSSSQSDLCDASSNASRLSMRTVSVSAKKTAKTAGAAAAVERFASLKAPNPFVKEADPKQGVKAVQTKPDVFLVDEHHLVLGGIQQQIQQQRFRNPGILINFDSHDDLAVPERVTSSLVGVKDVGAMIPHVEISSWIVPCIAAGVYDEIIWVTEYNTMFTQQTFQAGVALRSEIETDENRDAGEEDDGDSLCIIGDDVPQEWREYWQDQYVAIAQKRAKKRCFQGTRETVTTRGTAATRQTAATNEPSVTKKKRDSVATTKPFQMTVCTRESIASVIAHLASTKKDITVSMDLDFFSTTNPSRRCIPFNDLPSFRLPLIDLFARIPLLTCNAFFAHLDSFLKESELTDANLDNVCRALRTAMGDDSASSSSFSSVSFLSSTASHVSHRSLFATLYRLVHEHFRRAPQRAELLENLMRLALPEYKASWSEMNQSVTLFRSVYTAITSRQDCFSHLVVAQSLLYTPRRQSDAIEALFMSALE